MDVLFLYYYPHSPMTSLYKKKAAIEPIKNAGFSPSPVRNPERDSRGKLPRLLHTRFAGLDNDHKHGRLLRELQVQDELGFEKKRVGGSRQ